MLPIRQRHSNELAVIARGGAWDRPFLPSSLDPFPFYQPLTPECVCLTVHWMASFLSLGPANLLGIGRGVITFNMKRNAAKMPETCTKDVIYTCGCAESVSILLQSPRGIWGEGT
nr:uncharacterized protein LOC108075955 [Drosophila kikkawai]